jgi:hypothetical protein
VAPWALTGGIAASVGAGALRASPALAAVALLTPTIGRRLWPSNAGWWPAGGALAGILVARATTPVPETLLATAVALTIGLTGLAAWRPWTAWVAAALTLAPIPRWDERPNVLIVTIDALRCDTGQRVLAQIGPTTCVWSHAPWTLPALTALHTGEAPWDLGAGGRGFAPVPESASTLAELAANAGYRTTLISGGNPFTGRRYGLDQGFERVDHPWSSHRDALCAGTGRFGRPRPLAARLVLPDETHAPDDELVASAQQLLAQGGGQFVWLHLTGLHLPIDGLTLDRPRLLADPSTPVVTAWRAAYEQAATGAGSAVARLAAGLRPDDVLVVTADHGESFAPPWEHGGDLSDGLLRVPYVSRGVEGRPSSHLELSEALRRGLGAAPRAPVAHITQGDTLYGAELRQVRRGSTLIQQRRGDVARGAVELAPLLPPWPPDHDRTPADPSLEALGYAEPEEGP